MERKTPNMEQEQTKAPKKPYFIGDFALMQFTDDSGESDFTYWLVDKTTKTIRPFESENALSAVFAEDVNSAMVNITKIEMPEIDDTGEILDGVLEGFDLMGSEYLISDSGDARDIEFSPAQIRERYGKPVNEEREEVAAANLDKIMEYMKENSAEFGFQPVQVSGLQKDKLLMAFYISAMAYGNYAINDIIEDIKSRLSKEN